MKRYLSIWLAFLLLCSLSACRAKAPAAPEAPLPELTLIPDDTPDEPLPELTLLPETDSSAVDGASTPGGTQSPPENGTAPPSDSPSADEPAQTAEPPSEAEEKTLPEDGSYTSREDVALYLHLYAHLPGNFITKKEAEALGWPGGSLEPYAPGKCIGGDRFGNYEGQLPTAKGRRWNECDVDTLGAKSRGAKRIVYSNDGLIYYTEDHYQTFELLYGEE
ncbi:MAG: ribonuclease [Ruminococcaceae bacterium]|nr:ribonuclease [Oscillospiraceae bacterium]